MLEQLTRSAFQSMRSEARNDLDAEDGIAAECEEIVMDTDLL